MLVNHGIAVADEIAQLGPRVLHIHVPGEIRGKGRPRFSARGGFARAYTDAKTVNAETWVRACAIEQVGQRVLIGPLSVDVRVVVAVPESWSKKRKMEAIGGTVCPTGKPDADNIVKLLADALNGILWKDDSQIVELKFRKAYGTEPGAWLLVVQL